MRPKHNFNFAIAWGTQLKKESSEGKFQFQTKDIMIAVCIALSIVIIASSPWIWNYKLGLDLAKTNQLIMGLNDIDQQVQKLNTLKKQVQTLKNVNDLTVKSTHDPGPILEKVRLLLPLGTTVKSFSFQADNSVSLAVSIPTPVDAARLWTSLQNSNLFQSVEIQTISMLDQSQDYTLSLKLK